VRTPLGKDGVIFELIGQLIETTRIDPRLDPPQERPFDEEPLTGWPLRVVGQTAAQGCVERLLEIQAAAVHRIAQPPGHVVINGPRGSHAGIMMRNLAAVKMPHTHHGAYLDTATHFNLLSF
jgi:hypothetical protein